MPQPPNIIAYPSTEILRQMSNTNASATLSFGKAPVCCEPSFLVKSKAPLNTSSCPTQLHAQQRHPGRILSSPAWYRPGLFIARDSLNAKHEDVGYQLPLAQAGKLFITSTFARKPAFLTRTAHNAPVLEKKVTPSHSEGDPTS